MRKYIFLFILAFLVSCGDSIPDAPETQSNQQSYTPAEIQEMSLGDIQQVSSSDDSMTDEEESDAQLSLSGKIGKLINPKNITITASAKKENITGQISQREQELLSSQNLMSFPSATLTWGRKLRTSSDFPPGKFKVMHINTQTEQELKTFIRDTISVNSSVGGGMTDFGAYFIGNLDIGEDGLYDFTMTQDQAKTRVILNGRVILQGEDSSSIQVKLVEGSYRIEVEFQNEADTLQDFKLVYSKV